MELLKSLSNSPRLSKLWPPALVGLTLLAVIILAAGVPRFEPQPGGPFPFWVFQAAWPGLPPDEGFTPKPASSIGFWRALIALAVTSVFIAWIIVFILRPEARAKMLKRLAVYISILIVILVIYLNLNLEEAKPINKEHDDGWWFVPNASLVYTDPPATPEFINAPPPWLATLITVGIIALVLGLVWWWWQRRARPIRREDPLALLALQARQAVDTLQSGSDLKDTVLRCYQDMSQVLRDQRGIERQQGMTPREFEQYLTDLGLRNDPIRRLTRLFESVRYGAATASEREKREAIDCLNAIVRLCSQPDSLRSQKA